MKNLSLLFLLVASASAPALAADATDLINGHFDSSSRKERQDIARSVLSHTEELSAFVPRLSPSERSWVIAEQAEAQQIKDEAARNQRFIRLHESQEFQQHKIKAILDAAMDALQCVVNTSVGIRREMLCWSMASFQLSDAETLNYAIQNLIHHARLPKNIAEKAQLPLVSGFSTKFTWYSRGMLEYIVIPYLAGRIER